MLKEKIKLNNDEVVFIALLQEQIINSLQISKDHLAAEEIAYCLNKVYSKKELNLIIQEL